MFPWSQQTQQPPPPPVAGGSAAGYPSGDGNSSSNNNALLTNALAALQTAYSRSAADSSAPQSSNSNNNNNTLALSGPARATAPLQPSSDARASATTNNSMPTSTPLMASTMHQRSISPLAEALCAIPLLEKVEYLHALQNAPHLVEKESDPITFLRFANGDATAAARRLTVYWRMRKEIFGETRAFLPLLNDFSGTGALGVEELMILRSGAFCMLRNDTHERPVGYVDRELIPVAYRQRREVKLRVFFHFFQQLLSSPNSQKAGCVLLVRGGTNTAFSEDRNSTLTREAVAMVTEVFPLRIQAIHMIYFKQGNHALRLIFNFLVEQFGGFLSESVIVHNCASLEQAVVKLAAHGLSRQSLPTRIGGLWKFKADNIAGATLSETRNARLPSLMNGGSPGPGDNPAQLQPQQQQQQQQLNALFTLAAVAEQGSSLLENSNGNRSSLMPRQEAVAPAQNLTSLSEGSVNSIDDNSFIETISIRERGLATMMEALVMLPPSDKEAYLTAVREAPAVVQTESNPLKFLRFEKYNAWSAAKRLALYWKYRVEIFGQRAFLPFVQLSGGALCDEDLQALATGYLSILPGDSRGRPVLCYDPSKRPDYATQTVRNRLGFYFFSVLSEHPAAMNEGFVVIFIVSTQCFELSKLDGSTRKGVDVALDSFPIKNPELHVIYSPSPTASPDRSFMGFVLPVLLHVLGRMMNDRAFFHVGDTHDELHRKLAERGMSRPGLPAALSGGVTDTALALWRKNRQLLELQRCSRPQQLLLLQQHQQQQGGHQRQNLQPSLSPVVAPSAPAAVMANGNHVLPVPREVASSHPQDIDGAMELVAPSEKAAYLAAVKEVPDLVKKESDPLRFLKLANNNVVAAASRLAAYWRIRRKVFGDRAFLPMDQTVDGTMDRKDVLVLQTGFLMQLPNDSAGRSVICCDGSRLQKSSRASQLRCFFYMWSVVSENELSRTDGYTVLYTLTEPSFDRACKECLDLAMQAHPVKLKAFHLIGCSGGASENDFKRGPVRETMKFLDRSIQDKLVVHVCESRSKFASKLCSHDLSLDGLPKPFGGEWGIEEFAQWQELRIRKEWNLPIGSSTRKRAESYLIPTSTAPFLSSLNPEEKTERLRRMNVIHSRRKRERERVQMEVLREQCSSLREERRELSSEGRRLEGLIQSAEAIVATTGVNYKRRRFVEGK